MGEKKMSNKKITVRTGSLEEAAKEFIDIWHQVEQGHTPKAPIEKISFKDQRLLFKTLTPKRFEILEYVHERDGISIRLLAKELGRDYSNVHQDVKILHQLGLMLKNEKNDKYYVPWDVIVTEIPLSVVKKIKSSPHTPKQSPPRVAHG
jgi:predicted transcriptional regulator